MIRHTAGTLAFALAIGCARPPPVIEMAVPPRSVEPPAPPATAAAPPAPPAPPAASPFVVVSAHLDSRAIFEMEDMLLASAGDDIFELVNGTLRSRFDLAVGLPADDCQGISGIVGRFPDAAFLLVSWSSRECGSVLGSHRIHRWTGRAWKPLATPRRPVMRFMAVAGIEHSQGPGIVICDENAAGGGCGGRFTLLPRVERDAPTPVGRPISTRLGRPMFRFARSGVAFAFGADERDGRARAAIERFSTGSSRGETFVLPGERCTPAGIHVFDERNVVVAASCETGGAGPVLRFDGRRFTKIDMPPTARVLALTGEADSTLWIAAADGDAARVLRIAAGGEWAAATLPRRDPTDPQSGPFQPSRLVVRGEDVWAVGQGVLHARRADFDAP